MTNKKRKLTFNPYSQRGYALYIRPTLLGTTRTLASSPPTFALLYVLASPVGPFYPTGFRAITLEARSYAVRAWSGGLGDRKMGANYALVTVPARESV